MSTDATDAPQSGDTTRTGSGRSRSEDELTQRLIRWREAYLRGGLPSPSRSDRWQVLRAGVAGLWEFEAAEYWYADGWVQLTGRNETGKSSLMALTTLIPWLADVSGANIDTLGASARGKSFRYYVEPTTTDGDRRDAGAASSRGWLWVEYGRLDQDGLPQYFTTLGFFETRRATQSTFTRTWVTAVGAERVRSGLELLAGRAVQTPKDFAAVGGHIVVHPSASAFREYVADHLLDAGASDLEAVGKLLRVIRTPKLGTALSEGWVTEKLRESLPGLDPTEVAKLATGWAELEKVRLEMATAEAAVDALAAYLRSTWRPYLNAEIRHAADRAAAARTRLDEVTRTVRLATESHEKACAELEVVTAERDTLGRALAADEHAVDTLRESSRYREASERVAEVERVARDLELARGRAHDAAGQQERRRTRLAEARTAEEGARAEFAEALRKLKTAQVQLLASLGEAGIADQDAVVGEHDWDRLDRLLRDRHTRLRHLDDLFAVHDQHDLVARRAEDVATTAASAAETADSDAENAWHDAELERQSVADLLARWIVALPDEAPATDSLLDDLVAGLPRQAADDMPRLRDRLRELWHEPHRARADEALRQNAADRQETGAGIAALEAEDRTLRSAADPVVPAPPGLQRRERPAPGAGGTPLWRLLDAPGVEPDALAAIEAGLTAMGLIDAWVAEDGLYVEGRDGLDTVLTVSGQAEGASLTPCAGGSLADVLTCVGGPGQRAVDDLLAAVGWNSPGAYAIDRDGRWHTPDRAGRARLSRGEAELIGESARQRARERRLAEIAADLQIQRATLASLQVVRGDLQTLRSGLDDLLSTAPADDRLRGLLVVAAERDRRAHTAATSARQAAERAETLRAEANRSRTTAFEYASENSLPSAPDARRALHAAIQDAHGVLKDARHDHERASDRSRSAGEAEREATARQGEHEAAVAATNTAATEVAALQRSEGLLRAQLDADDTQVLDQVRELERDISEQRRQVGALGTRWETLVTHRAEADTALRLAERDRSDRERHRDDTYQGFATLLDAGVADDLDLALPQAESRTVDAIRSQVAAVRTTVTPRDWPSDEPSQGRAVQRRRDALRNTEGLRVLEASGRTVTLTTEGRLPMLQVVVDATGVPHPVRTAMQRLRSAHDDLKTAYDDTVRRNLEELLGSTFIDHLRRRLATAYELVQQINDVLKRHPTGTSRTVLRIDLKPVEGASGQVLETLRGSSSLLDPAIAERVREFLGTRIQAARQTSLSEGDVEWGERLAEALDYRHWWDVRLMKRAGEGGTWSAVNATSYAQQSGGARVVLLMLPLVATLAAMYRSMPTAPHPFWLDEAFDGLDQTNREMVLELLTDFDFDVLLAGPGRLLNSPAVATGAIYQVVRADYPYPGADLTCELWSGGELTPLRVDDLAEPGGGPDDSLFGDV